MSKAERITSPVAARLGAASAALESAMKALEVAARVKDLLDERERNLLVTAHDTLVGIMQRIDGRLWGGK